MFDVWAVVSVNHLDIAVLIFCNYASCLLVEAVFDDPDARLRSIFSGSVPRGRETFLSPYFMYGPKRPLVQMISIP